MLSAQQAKGLADQKELLEEKNDDLTKAIEGASDWSEYRAASSEHDDVEEGLEKLKMQTEITLLYDLQIRRDFLYDYVKEKNPKFTYNLKSGLSSEKRLAEQIKQLEAAITPTLGKAFRAPLLLKKQHKDKDGISKNLGEHFQYLFPEEKQQEKRIPLVELLADGVKFFWHNSVQARFFAKILVTHHIDAIVVDSNDVMVSHADVKKLLVLAQFRPTNINLLLRDWYSTKNLDRPLLLTKNLKQGDQDDKTSPVKIKSISMVPGKDHQTIKVLLTTTMQPSEEKKPHHVVLLVDTSDKEVEATLLAISKQMAALPPTTLVTVQSLEGGEILCSRIPAGELKGHKVFHSKARPGYSASLDMVLPSTAVFVRKDPQDLLVSKEEMNNTTFLLVLMRGPENPDALVGTMRESTDFPFYSARLPGTDQKHVVSYGIKKAPAEHLPIFLPIVVGDKKYNVTAVRRFAHLLETPLVEIESKDIFEKTPLAIRILNSLKDRVPECYIRLTYKDGQGNEHGLQSRQVNLFNHYNRNIFFQVPSDAKDIQFFIEINGKSHIATYQSSVISDKDAAKTIIDQSVKNQFSSVLAYYYAEEQALNRQLKLATTRTQHDFTVNEDDDRRLPQYDEASVPIAPSVEGLTEDPAITKVKANHRRLKGDAQNKLRALLAEANADNLKKQITEVLKLIPTRELDGSIMIIPDDDLFIKQDHRDNDLAKPAPIQLTTADLMNAIHHEQFELIDVLIPIVDVNTKVNGLTPLLAAINKFIYIWNNQYRLDIDATKSLSFINPIEKIIARTKDVCVQDAKGNTALHLFAKSFCNQMAPAFTIILEKAFSQGALLRLLDLKNADGNTVEVLLQKVISTNPLLRAKAENLIQTIATYKARMAPSSETFVGLILNYQFEDAKKQLNAHKELLNTPYEDKEGHRATPLIHGLVKLKNLKIAQVPDEKRIRELRAFLTFLINQEGIDFTIRDKTLNTPLNRAVFIDEFDLTSEIIKKAHQNNTLKEIIGLTNQGKKTFFDDLYERCSPVDPNRKSLLALLESYGVNLDEFPEKFPLPIKVNHQKAARWINQINRMGLEEIAAFETFLWGKDCESFRVPQHGSGSTEVLDGKKVTTTGSFSDTIHAIKLQKIKCGLLLGKTAATAGSTPESTAEEGLAKYAEEYAWLPSLSIFAQKVKVRSKPDILHDIQAQQQKLYEHSLR